MEGKSGLGGGNMNAPRPLDSLSESSKRVSFPSCQTGRVHSTEGLSSDSVLHCTRIELTYKGIGHPRDMW